MSKNEATDPGLKDRLMRKAAGAAVKMFTEKKPVTEPLSDNEIEGGYIE